MKGKGIEGPVQTKLPVDLLQSDADTLENGDLVLASPFLAATCLRKRKKLTVERESEAPLPTLFAMCSGVEGYGPVLNHTNHSALDGFFDRAQLSRSIEPEVRTTGTSTKILAAFPGAF